MSKEYETIEKEELGAWGIYALDYFLEVLRGEKTIEKAREDILSFRGSEFYTGSKEIQKDLKGE
jgi:hypothetical protein